MICPTGKTEYFFEEDWTAQIRLKGCEKSSFTRRSRVSALALSAFEKGAASRNRLC
jgi:hypothetical protein